jgi:hypothetical protein
MTSVSGEVVARLELLPIHLVVRESTGSSPDHRPGQPGDGGTVTATPHGQRGRT